MKLMLPDLVQHLLKRLNHCGYEAYVVGGCVRDLLRGQVPTDYDLTTNARPEQIKQCFAGCSMVEVGIQHGTVGVVYDHQVYEITTYRVETASQDHRHPDAVSFTGSLQEDLSRRDFTINAMAYAPSQGVVDPFDGQRDLQNRILRTVGDPHQRFEEDALRILRGLRFSSTLEFSLEPNTVHAMESQKHLLGVVSKERLWAELQKLLCGQAAAAVLQEHFTVLGKLLPELSPLIGLDQKNPHHHLDVWEHSLAALNAVPPIAVLRWCMLLHDCGKSSTFSVDQEGIGHFYQHAVVGAALADTLLRRFRAPNDMREQLVRLIRHHGDQLKAEACSVKRYLNRFGEPFLRQLLEVQRADVLAQVPQHRTERLHHLSQVEQVLGQVLAENSCFSLRQLAINGKDLLALGFSGRMVGQGLEFALQGVMQDHVANEREELLSFVSKMIDKML